MKRKTRKQLPKLIGAVFVFGACIAGMGVLMMDSMAEIKSLI